MKNLLILVGLLGTLSVNAQSNELGVLSIGGGGGLSFAGATIDITNPFGGNTGQKITLAGGGANTNYNLRVQIGVNDLISVGGYYRREGAVYGAKTGNLSTDIIAISHCFGVEGKIYPLNNDKFNLYVAPSIGYSVASLTQFLVEGSGSGFNYAIVGGLSKYWTDNFGMTFDLGYAGGGLSIEFDNPTYKTAKSELKYNGFYLSLGLIVKFGVM